MSSSNRNMPPEAADQSKKKDNNNNTGGKATTSSAPGNNSRNNNRSGVGGSSEWLRELQDPDMASCHVCGCDTGCRRCGTCGNRWYCGRECQREDWPEHKAACQTLGVTRARAAFAERMGASYHREDDQSMAGAAQPSLADMPALPHLILGNLVLGPKPGQVFLQAWGAATLEKMPLISVHVTSANGKGVETNTDTLLLAFQRLLGRSLDETVKGGYPIAIKRCCLVDKVLILSPRPTKPPSVYTS